MTVLRIATRRSPLAMAQSRAVAAAVTGFTGVEAVLVEVDSVGDRSGAPLREFGGVGVFVTAVRDAVLAGHADLAVHSLKDLPTADAPGISLLAIPAREAANDVLASAAGLLRDLPHAARVGTGSPRRRAQLLAQRPDLDVADIRGNVDTRLRKLDAGEYDAVVLARAGLVRLGLLDRVSELLSTDLMLPAPGQGALAVECATAAKARFAPLAAALDDPATRAAVVAERAALARLQAGCAAPMGAFAHAAGGRWQLTAAVFAPDGSSRLTASASAPAGECDPADLGRKAAAELLDLGAGLLLGESVP
jgi:hydroxymethylbilane synthase